MPYLDYAASAPMRPAALDAYAAAAREAGNAASAHNWGRRADRRVETARAQVAALFGRTAREVVWTAGGTEADNLAILGAAARATGRHLLVSAIEHAAVLGPALALERQGWQVERLPVNRDGVVLPEVLAAHLRPDTALVSIMAVNNEMGALQPLPALAALTRASGALFHTDAVQASLLDLSDVDADLVSVSAHKMGGPMGVGALLVRAGTRLAPVLHGGQHERGLRPGTLNVPGVVAFGVAAAEVLAGRSAEASRVAALRERLRQAVLVGVPDALAVGRADALAPHILCLVFAGMEGDALVTQLDLAGVNASSGAACSTLGTEPSHVLPALGLDAAEVAGSLRLSLGWATVQAEVDEAARAVVDIVARMRAMRPMAL